MRSRHLIVAGLLCLALSACAGVTQTIEQAIPPAPKTPQQTVFEIKAALISAEKLASPWAAQICPVAASCKDARVVDVMNGIVTTDTLVSSAETAVKANAATTDSTQKAITDAQAALTALQQLLQQYGISTSTTKGA